VRAASSNLAPLLRTAAASGSMVEYVPRPIAHQIVRLVPAE
jgi:hypothetical protein